MAALLARAHRRPLGADRLDDAGDHEYFRRQCYISLDPDEQRLPHIVEAIGADKILFASDFPHYDAIFPGAVAAVSARTDLSGDAKRLILGGNAARLLGLGEG